MTRPKIIITRLKIIRKDGFGQYFSPLGKNTKSPIFDLDLYSDSKYPKLNINTEKDLCRFLFENYGIGKYFVIAVIGGRRGFWNFWKGEIEKEGFICDEKAKYTKEALFRINKMKRDLDLAESEEERDLINDEIEIEKDIARSHKYRRYGFKPFLRPSGRRGTFVMWDEKDNYKESEEEKEEQFEDWENQNREWQEKH